MNPWDFVGHEHGTITSEKGASPASLSLLDTLAELAALIANNATVTRINQLKAMVARILCHSFQLDSQSLGKRSELDGPDFSSRKQSSGREKPDRLGLIHTKWKYAQTLCGLTGFLI